MTTRIATAISIAAACSSPAHDAPDASHAGDAGKDATSDASGSLPAGRKLFALMRPETGTGAELEVFALDPMPHFLTAIDLGQVSPEGFAVSSTGARAIVATWNSLLLVDTGTGSVQRVALAGAVDVVMSPDDSTAWVAVADAIDAIDPATGDIRHTYAVPNAYSLAISGDGLRVAAAAGDAVQLLDVNAGMVHRVGLHTSGASNCGLEAFGATFAGDKLAVWDPNCDEMYVVDPMQYTQLRNIVFGRDQGTRTSRDYIAYSKTSAKAYAWHESQQIAISDLSAAGTPKNLDIGKPGAPVAIAAAPDGSQLFIALYHYEAQDTPDTLALLDPLTELLTEPFITATNGGLHVVTLRVTP